MKLSRKLSAILASVTMLSLAFAPAVVGSAHTAQAAANFDIPMGTVTQSPATIRVWSYGNESRVHLFSFDGDDPQIITTRSVQNGTTWFTDEYKTAPNENGVESKYYRVSTNEWIIQWDVDTRIDQTGQY